MPETRVFLLASSLTRLIMNERGSNRIQEGYFRVHRDRDLSVRVETESGSLNLMMRDATPPQNEPAGLPPAHAEALLHHADGKVDYLETLLDIGLYQASVKRFVSPEPLNLVTVSFSHETDAAQFQPPVWLGAEITNDTLYQLRSIALSGLPAVTETEISNIAVENLLDILNIGLNAPASPVASHLPETVSAAEAEPETENEVDDGSSDIEDSVIRELARSLSPRRRDNGSNRT